MPRDKFSFTRIPSKHYYPYFLTNFFDLYEDSCHLYADLILRIITLVIFFFYKHYPYVYDLSKYRKKSDALKRGLVVE